jgi:hypothetical protein
VVVTADRERVVADLTIVWVGGSVTRLTSRLNRVGQHRRVASSTVLDLMRHLGPHYTDEQIAFMLNAKRYRTGQGNAFTARRVAPLRARPAFRVQSQVRGHSTKAQSGRMLLRRQPSSA